MKVIVQLLPTRKETKEVELPEGASVGDALKALRLHPDAWIAVREDEPIPLDEPLRDGDRVKLIAVVSGG